MKERRQGRKGRVGLSLSLLLAISGGFAGTLPSPSVERIEEDLLGIQNHISNVTGRFRRPGGMQMMGPGASAEEPKGPRTPAQECCQPSLDKIGERLRDLVQMVDQLDVLHAREGNAEALDALKDVRGWLNQMFQGMAAFKLAKTPERAQQALQGLVRPFNELRNSLRALQACCPIPSPAKEAKPLPSGKDTGATSPPRS